LDTFEILLFFITFKLEGIVNLQDLISNAVKLIRSLVFFCFFFRLRCLQINIFLFCTYNTVSITLKRVSKRSSFRYVFQEHLLKFLILAMTHSELLLRDHCISRHFKFKTYDCLSIYQCYQPLYLPNLRGKIEKILYYTRFITHFVALVCFKRLKNACDRMVSYNTRIINNY
jgi:hypothetical protein